ncbi:MAG: carboxypeptidase regulatory-like domain-containing protein [Chloracidobacterium sp.]|nr:carboxypeptidase regulatory-like domain-containing protein [Chloracidobacterium sp.]
MRPGPLNLFLISSTLLLCVFIQSIKSAGAQTPQRDSRPRMASIGGRVTVGGAPAAYAMVTVEEADLQLLGERAGVESPQRPPIEVRTDNDGRYRVTGLTEGNYVVRALSKAYVFSKDPFGVEAFKSVTLDDGESRDDIDIALVRGGVITGRVADAEGRPVIGTEARLFSADEKGRPKSDFDPYNLSMFQTDDRGNYRIYGLTAGRYILGVGGALTSDLAGRKFHTTFYPDATDRSQAKIIEVKEGAELTDIDIRLGAEKETHQVSGRVIDAETRKPLPGISVLCMEAPDKKNWGTRSGTPATTDGEGRFRCADLNPGRYELSLWERTRVGGEYYSEKTVFEMAGSDVDDLEVRAVRGSTISGVVVIEGASDPAVRAMLQRMSVGVQIAGYGDYDRAARTTARVAVDGGFRLTGAPPGTASFFIEGEQDSAFSIRRIERDGVEIRSAFEIRQGEQITGVRIVLAQNKATIRGQVDVAGVNLPEGCQLQIWAITINTTTGNESLPAFRSNGSRHVTADEKRRFLIERLTSGEYELRLNAMVRVSQYYWSSAPGTSEVKSRVILNGPETVVNLNLGPVGPVSK